MFAPYLHTCEKREETRSARAATTDLQTSGMAVKCVKG